MKAAVKKAWESRSPFERMVVAGLAAVLAIAGYALLLQSAERSERIQPQSVRIPPR